MATYTLTFNYPDGAAARLLDSFCAATLYDRFKLPGETKAQYLDRQVKTFIRDNVVAGEVKNAERTAGAAAATAVANELPIT